VDLAPLHDWRGEEKRADKMYQPLLPKIPNLGVFCIFFPSPVKERARVRSRKAVLSTHY
jgi:hypothetical protein